MISRTKLQGRLLASTIIASSVLTQAPALAQDMPAETAESGNDQAIVVTGTLVRNPNLVASTPVNVVGEEEIELQQANVAEELLRELPGAVPAIGSAVNNGNGGASNVDLRGLGPNRNIVLLDGVRLTPADIEGLFDLNNIPLALIQRVDVLTGGASTTYGADAVSGVVNFITRRDFAGIDINLSEQITERGDGNVFRADVTIGANFDDGRGNATLSIGYQEADALYQGARDFSLFSLSSGSGAGGGSGSSVPSRFSLGTIGTRQVNADGTDFLPTAAFTSFNFNPYNIFQTPFERFNIYGSANYQISDAIEIYTRGLFSKNTVETIVAPSGALPSLAVFVPLNNPFLTPALRNAFCQGNGISAADCAAAANPALQPGDAAYRQVESNLARRFVEGGPRVSSFLTTYFDYRVGARGGITSSIDWDVWGSYGESENVQTQTGYSLNSRIRQSLLTGPGGTACRDISNGCTPINWFGPAGSITPDQVDFLTEASTIILRTSLAQARATISGDFGWTIPWATQPVSFAVGAEFREYGALQQADALAQGGDLGGAGGAEPNFSGRFNVYEAFGELILPIVADRPFFDELTLEAGIRYSSYNIRATGAEGFTTTTWKVGGSWAPFDGLRFRGNYARSVRAPNIEELFEPVTSDLTNLLDDPCATVDDAGDPIAGRPLPSGTLRAICLAQGATGSTIDQIPQPTSGQANSTTTGDLNLEPETATSWTVGAVFQPNFIPGLSLSLDYYHIRVTNAITQATPGDAIAACFGDPDAAGNYNPAAGAETSDACTIIRRDRLSGGLNGDPSSTPGLFLPITNLGRLITSGVDFNANYRRDLGFAGLSTSFVLTWTEQARFRASPTSIDRDCVGLYSANCGSEANDGSIQPRWQWSMRTTLSFGSIDLSMLWRHIDAVEYEFADTAPLFRGTLPASAGPLAGREVDFNRIPSYDYFDLTARFAVNDHLTLTFSVQNLLDKQPPIVGNNAGTTTFNSGNTFPSTYDSLGRRFAASARIRF